MIGVVGLSYVFGFTYFLALGFSDFLLIFEFALSYLLNLDLGLRTLLSRLLLKYRLSLALNVALSLFDWRCWSYRRIGLVFTVRTHRRVVLL